MAAVAANGISSDNQYQRDVIKMVDLLSKLNPLAKEFFPSSYHNKSNVANGSSYKIRTNGYNQGRKKMNNRAISAERGESIKRTVYVSDIDHHITEEYLAELFSSCGQVIDCRVCGDPYSTLRFAFIEFDYEEGAKAALSLRETILGSQLGRVLPSKTTIFPVNPELLPRSNDERDMVMRTVYCTNIDKKATQSEVKHCFEQVCGEVSRLRLLGDNLHSTRIAFVEFVQAESAILALNCSGMVLGSLQVRISPSKTPVRPRIPLATSQ